MVEIIETGKLPGEKEYTTTCHSCKTKFKFKRKEAAYKSGDQRDGSYLQINCPLHGCNNVCMVSENQGSSNWYNDR